MSSPCDLHKHFATDFGAVVCFHDWGVQLTPHSQRLTLLLPKNCAELAHLAERKPPSNPTVALTTIICYTADMGPSPGTSPSKAKIGRDLVAARHRMLGMLRATLTLHQRGGAGEAEVSDGVYSAPFSLELAEGWPNPDAQYCAVNRSCGRRKHIFILRYILLSSLVSY